MGAVVYIPLFCAIALAATASVIARRASPRRGSTALVGAALAAALAADISLAVLTGARLIDAAPLASALDWRPEAAGPHPVPLTVSLAAAAALLLSLLLGQAERRRSSITARQLRSVPTDEIDGELLVVRSPTRMAFTLPATRSSPGRILVSDAMLRALDAGERRVLLAHERSHLRHHHDRYRRLVGVAASLNPLLRPAVGAVDFLLERWADEDAAADVGCRTVTAQALARAAIADAPRRDRVWQPSFAAQQVSRRIDALLSPSPAPAKRWAIALPFSISVIAAVTAAVATHDLAHLFDLLRGDG